MSSVDWGRPPEATPYVDVGWTAVGCGEGAPPRAVVCWRLRSRALASNVSLVSGSRLVAARSPVAGSRSIASGFSLAMSRPRTVEYCLDPSQALPTEAGDCGTELSSEMLVKQLTARLSVPQLLDNLRILVRGQLNEFLLGSILVVPISTDVVEELIPRVLRDIDRVYPLEEVDEFIEVSSKCAIEHSLLGISSAYRRSERRSIALQPAGAALVEGIRDTSTTCVGSSP